MTDVQHQAEKQKVRDLNLDPITRAPGSHPVGTGVGAVGGLAAGVVVGSVAGPLGTLVGGVVGTVVGGLAGKTVGEVVRPTPTADETYWRSAYAAEPYYDPRFAYEDYAPAYRSGHIERLNSTGRWDQIENDLQSTWDNTRGTSRLDWGTARLATRAAWYRADNALYRCGPADNQTQ